MYVFISQPWGLIRRENPQHADSADKLRCKELPTEIGINSVPTEKQA